MKNLGYMDIYKPAYGDCSNQGISSRHDQVIVVDNFDHDAADNAVVVVRDKILNGTVDRIRAVPANSKGKWSMFGGCFVYTNNGIVPNSGMPIPLHDRFE